MPRIYSNYTDEEYKKIEAASKELGMSMSAYQRYVTALSLPLDTRTGSKTVPELIKLMFANLSTLKKGDKFIVSTLLPEDWPNISCRSDKITLAKTLAKYVKEHSSKYTINQVLSDGTNQYIVL